MTNFQSKHIGLKLLLINLIICIFCATTALGDYAEDNPAEIPNEEKLSVLEQKLQKVVSIDVSDVPIEMVIRQLTEQVDIDFIISPDVTGHVTVTLTEVTVKEALQSILEVHGFAFIQGEDVIRILPRGEIPDISERLVTETYEIVYADVTEVVEALQDFKSQQGSVSSVKGTSYIIVTDQESKVRDIANLLKKIDRITPRVLVEVRIYDITCKDNYDLGVEWAASRRTNLSSTSRVLDDDITVSKGGSNTYLESLTDPALISGFSAGTNKTADSTMGYLRFAILNRHIDIDAQLRAEKENIEAKLLANPRITVVDNGTALFDIVTEHPYVERTITGSTVTETVKFKNVGTKLTVTPHVTRDEMIRLHITPEFGIVVGQVEIATSNVPIVDTRKVDTTALIKDGQTVVLGGLKKKDTAKQMNKIPVLGDIPILGNLFRFEGESTTVAELVVFITPYIITESIMTEDEQQAFDITEFNSPNPTPTKAEINLFGK